VLNKKKNAYYKEIETLKVNSERYDSLLATVEEMRAYLGRMGGLNRQGVQGTGDPV